MFKPGLLLFFTSLFLLSIEVTAQQEFMAGYVINNNGDTLKGQINLRSNIKNARSCEFRLNDSGKIVIYKPGDIYSYKINNNKYYVSKTVEIDSTKQKLYLEYLVDGIVDLYFLQDPIDSYYFIEKEGKIYLLKNTVKTFRHATENKTGYSQVKAKTYTGKAEEYKRVLRYLFQDQPDIYREINSTSFTYRPLINLTKDYHNLTCDDYACIDYSRTTKTKISLEPSLGFAYTGMALKNSSDRDYSFDPVVSLNIRFKFPKLYYLWNFLTGVYYSSSKFDGDFHANINSLFSPEQHYRIKLDYQYIKIPITVEYSLAKKKVQPFFSISYNNIFIFDAKPEVTGMFPGNYEGSEVSRVFSERMYPYEAGFMGSCGVRFKVNDSWIFARGDIGYRLPVITDLYILDYARYNSFIFRIGYQFK